MPAKRRSTAQPAPKIQKQRPQSYIEKTTAPAEPPAPPASSTGRRKRRVPREPLSTRVPVTLRDRMYDYEESTGMGVQAMVEEALTEYLEKRGFGETS